MTNTNYIGQPTSRVDGRAKVTGQAKYAAEFNVPNLTYGYVVSSEIAKGKIKKSMRAKHLRSPVCCKFSRTRIGSAPRGSTAATATK